MCLQWAFIFPAARRKFLFRAQPLLRVRNWTKKGWVVCLCGRTLTLAASRVNWRARHYVLESKFSRIGAQHSSAAISFYEYSSTHTTPTRIPPLDITVQDTQRDIWCPKARNVMVDACIAVHAVLLFRRQPQGLLIS